MPVNIYFIRKDLMRSHNFFQKNRWDSPLINSPKRMIHKECLAPETLKPTPKPIKKTDTKRQVIKTTNSLRFTDRAPRKVVFSDIQVAGKNGISWVSRGRSSLIYDRQDKVNSCALPED